MSNKTQFFHNVKKAKRQRLNAVYTKSELLILTKIKFIEVYPHYNYTTKETTFEVRSIKNVIWETHETPEEIINEY